MPSSTSPCSDSVSNPLSILFLLSSSSLFFLSSSSFLFLSNSSSCYKRSQIINTCTIGIKKKIPTMILQGQCCVNFMFYFQTSNAHELTRSLDLILLNLKDLIGRPVIWNVLDVSNVAPSGESISRTSPSSQNTRRVDFFWKADQQLKNIY